MTNRPPKKRSNRLFVTAATAAVLLPIAAVAALGEFSPPEFASRMPAISGAVSSLWDTARKRVRSAPPIESMWRRPSSASAGHGGILTSGVSLGMPGTPGGPGVNGAANYGNNPVPGFVVPPMLNGSNAGSFGAAAGLGNRGFDSGPPGVVGVLPPVGWIPPNWRPTPGDPQPEDPPPYWISYNPPGGPGGGPNGGPGGGPNGGPSDYPDGGLGDGTGEDLPPVPEPETWVMLIAGIGLIAGLARRRKSSGE